MARQTPNPDPPLLLHEPTRSPSYPGTNPPPGRVTPARDRSAHRVHRRLPPPLSAAHLLAVPCGAHAQRPGVTTARRYRTQPRHRGAARSHRRSRSRPRSALRSNSLRRSAPPRSAACSAASNLRGPSGERQPAPLRCFQPRVPRPAPLTARRIPRAASCRAPALLPALPGTAAAAGGSGGGTDCGPPRCAARRDSGCGRGKKRVLRRGDVCRYGPLDVRIEASTAPGGISGRVASRHCTS